MRGRQVFFETLLAHGVDRIFGLQGGHIQPIWDHLAQLGVRIVDVRDEGAAVHMAHAHAALSGQLDTVPYTADPIFNLSVPSVCPDVPPDVLNPRSTWPDASAYDAQAKKLAAMFAENFKTFAATAAADVREAGPRG